MQWPQIIFSAVLPIVTGLFCWVGTLAALKTDIEWIKDRLGKNEKATAHLAGRLERHIDGHR